ncbi:MAG: phosphotransferase [Acidimicrobiales bacterium]
MSPEQPRSFGPGVRAAIDDLGLDIADLHDAGDDRGVTLLRPATMRVDVGVLQQRAPDPTGLLDEADRLLWLAGVAPAPRVLASGRADEGDEAVVVHLGADATSASAGHPMGPEALVDALAVALDALHRRPTDHCPFAADTATLRGIVDDRVARGLVPDAVDGPYVGRGAAELAGIFDDLMADLGEVADPVFVHGALDPARIWLDPSGEVTFLGWQWAGIGDRHLDLAAAAMLLTRLHGPALVAPFFDAYGFDRVDIRRLDAHQLLAHLLT